MPEVSIEIGGRNYEVACQAGEEAHLQSAAGLLNAEATHLINAAGRLPEPKVLLMAGLMLADKMAAGADPAPAEAGVDKGELEALEAKLAAAEARVSALETQLADIPEAAEPEKVVETVVEKVVDTAALERMTLSAEALADRVEIA